MQERYIAQQFGQIEDRLTAGDARMSGIDSKLSDLEDELRRNSEITKQIHEILLFCRSGLKVLGWVGTAAKWIASIVAGVSAVWAAYQFVRHGIPPK